MMSKKIQRVAAVDSSIYGLSDDSKTRFRHQTLMQDYQELVKETEGARGKLETMNQRKSILSAEVRFLRRRYKYLLETKSSKPPQEHFAKPQPFDNQPKGNKKEKLCRKKESTPRNLPTIFEVNQKKRNFNGKEAVLGNLNPVFDVEQEERIAIPVFDSKQKESTYSRLEASFQNQSPVFDLNHKDPFQKDRSYGGKQNVYENPAMVFDLNKKEKTNRRKEAAKRNAAPLLDLNQTERTWKGGAVQPRAPIFDLNQISREEEELQGNCEQPSRNEDLKRSSNLTRGGSDEQHNDLKLTLLCRNAGSGSNRVGKRKITWQDQVALRV